MECPYCRKIMELGKLYGRSISLKWIPIDKDKGIIISNFIKGIILEDEYEDGVKAYYCNNCNKMIIDVPSK